jgi:hypothetical protein
MLRSPGVFLSISCLWLSACDHLAPWERPNLADPPADTSVGLTPRCGRGRCGYVNRDGVFAIPPTYKVAKPFSEGLAAVYQENVGWGVIDPSGNYVIEPTFAFIGPFSEGLAAACPNEKNLNSWIYLDRMGKVAIEIKYDAQFAYPFHNGAAWLRCTFLFSTMSKQIDRTGRVVRRIYPR